MILYPIEKVLVVCEIIESVTYIGESIEKW